MKCWLKHTHALLRWCGCGIISLAAGWNPAAAQDASGVTVPGVFAAEKGLPNAEADGGEKISEVKAGAVGLRERYHNLRNLSVRMDEVTRVGEKLTYLAKWRFVPAGEVTLQVRRVAKVRDRDALVFEMRTEANDFLSMFYEVNDSFKSFVDVADGKSYLFRRQVREGRYLANDRLEFDYAKVGELGLPEPVSQYSKYEAEKEPVFKTPRPIPGPVQDPLSIVYYLRHLKFDSLGASHQVLMGSRKQVSIVTFTAARFETLDLGELGHFDCVVVSPKSSDTVGSDGLIVANGAAEIWLEKNTGVPLFAKVDIPVGTATIQLIKAENTDLVSYGKK